MSLRLVQICKETICEIKLSYNVQQVSLLDEGVGWVGNSKFINPSVQRPPPPGPRNIAANFYLVSSQTVFLLRNRRAQYEYILQWLGEAQKHLRTVESSTNPTPPHSSIS